MTDVATLPAPPTAQARSGGRVLIRGRETMRSGLLSRARSLVRRAGWDVTRHDPQRRRNTLAEGFAQLARVSPPPGTLIDVGVARGTPEMYDAFPTSSLLLVEPLQEWVPDIERILTTRQGRYEIAAASSRTGAIELNVPAVLTHASAFAKDDSGLDHGWTVRTVPTATLDEVVEKHSCPAPYVLKVDVEGGELDVLKGAERVLPECAAVVLEVTLVGAFEGGATFADITRFLDERGFCIYDVVGGFCREQDLALYQIDAVFVPKDAEHRAHRSPASGG